MSQENVEIVRAMFEDFLTGATEYDADGVLTRLPGGRLVHWKIHLTQEEALEAAGLPEQDAHADF